MHLKRLELQGFKSFADKTILEFMPGITTVIGPNGSGKSNISDAIRWVLGEQSIKSLRGTKSEDIIFAGTQSRKSLGFAEVNIVIDNSDGKLPIEFSEVTITRKIYRSGETGYYINKTPCRLKDVLELFMDTGIGKDGYSIIGQGKVDEILSNKSEERRHIFEEAAGIVKYRARKQESEKKLEQTKLNLVRISDILLEIENNIEPLKVQSQKAKEYLDLRNSLKSIEVGLFVHNIKTLKNKIEEIGNDTNILQSDKENQEEKLDQMQVLKTNIRETIDNITNEIERIQNIGYESSNSIGKLNSDISVAKERKTNNLENYKRYEAEQEELKLKIIEFEKEKKLKLDKKGNLFQDKEKFIQELEEKQKELESLTKKLSVKDLEIEAKKEKIEKDIDLKYEKLNDISLKEANYENYQKREKVLAEEIRVGISNQDSLRLSKQELSKDFYEIESKKAEIVKQLEGVAKKKEESNNKIKAFDEQINNLQSESRIKESRLKFLIETEKEKEGYTKSVKSLLLECEKQPPLKKGVHGTIASLISVSKEYEVAIEMALGGSLQNIVTDSEQDAKRLVEHLRKFNLGRASFLPISTVKGKKIDRLIRNGLDGVIGIASELVKFEEKYEQIILNLIGRTVIVDNMDTAILLAKQNNYSFKIVTLKGDIINPSGAIQGGSIACKTVNILGRASQIEELEKELKQKNKKIEELITKKEGYINSIKDFLQTSQDLEKTLQQIDITYATEKQKILALEENIKGIEERIAKGKQEQEYIKQEKQKLIEGKEQDQRDIKKLEEKIENANEEIKKYAELNKDDQSYIDDINLDITNLKISVSSFDESETSIDELVERINQDIENSNKSINSKEELKSKIIQDNKIIEEQVLENEKQIEKIKQDVENSSSKIGELKEQRIQRNKQLDIKEKEILDQIKTIEGLSNQILKIDMKKSKIEQDLEQTINNLWEEYEITPNNADGYEKPENLQVTTKKVNSIRNKIKSLGSINIDSIEEYKKTRQRYDFMSEQKLDLENAITKLHKVISEITVTMKEQFTKQFRIINKNFNEVFKELFSGGKAELILTDEQNILECGIDIHVQPPGKKLQNMMLLSGGEKAFTAIALLFAILKINPAPICVLDEIEAALDEVNVYRFADYLKKFTKFTQFLVITHRKGTMEIADSVYGITMEENGISKLLSIKLSKKGRAFMRQMSKKGPPL